MMLNNNGGQKMTNRQRVISAIRSMYLDGRLLDEIGYYLDTYSDMDGHEGYDEADALNDCLRFAEHNDEKDLVRACVGVLVEVGFYKPRDRETVVMGRDGSPLLGGVRYDCDSAWCEWIEN
jgi:hypothetical protein